MLGFFFFKRIIVKKNGMHTMILHKEDEADTNNGFRHIADSGDEKIYSMFGEGDGDESIGR